MVLFFVILLLISLQSLTIHLALTILIFDFLNALQAQQGCPDVIQASSPPTHQRVVMVLKLELLCETKTFRCVRITMFVWTVYI